MKKTDFRIIGFSITGCVEETVSFLVKKYVDAIKEAIALWKQGYMEVVKVKDYNDNVIFEISEKVG